MAGFGVTLEGYRIGSSVAERVTGLWILDTSSAEIHVPDPLLDSFRSTRMSPMSSTHNCARFQWFFGQHVLEVALASCWTTTIWPNRSRRPDRGNLRKLFQWPDRLGAAYISSSKSW